MNIKGKKTCLNNILLRRNFFPSPSKMSHRKDTVFDSSIVSTHIYLRHGIKIGINIGVKKNVLL